MRFLPGTWRESRPSTERVQTQYAMNETHRRLGMAVNEKLFNARAEERRPYNKNHNQDS